MMSWLSELARRLGDNTLPASTGGEMDDQTIDKDPILSLEGETGIDWSKAPGTLPSTPDSRHTSTVPTLDVEQYVRGEWEGPYSVGDRGQLSVGPMPDLIDPTLPQYEKEPGEPGFRGRAQKRPMLSAVGATQMAGAEAKKGLSYDPGPKTLRDELDELRQQYQAGGTAGGAAGSPAPPPFSYDWSRPPTPDMQRAQPFEFDRTDPMGAEVREARPRPAEYERDRQRYEKLLGS